MWLVNEASSPRQLFPVLAAPNRINAARTATAKLAAAPGLFSGGVHGDGEAEVYGELCRAAEEWVTTIREDGNALPPATAGKKYRGKSLVRVSPDVHQRAALKAMLHHESLNQLVERALAQA